MFQQILIALGGSAVLLGVVAFLVRSIIKHFLSKDIEAYKSELRLQTEKSIVEHTSKFRNVYTKQAEIIAQLYKLSIPLRGQLNGIASTLDDKRRRNLPIQLSEEECMRLVDPTMTIWNYFHENRLYLPSALADDVNALLIKAVAIALKGAFCHINVDSTAIHYDLEQSLAGKDAEALLSNVPDLIAQFNEQIKNMEAEFRETVGIH